MLTAMVHERLLQQKPIYAALKQLYLPHPFPRLTVNIEVDRLGLIQRIIIARLGGVNGDQVELRVKHHNHNGDMSLVHGTEPFIVENDTQRTLEFIVERIRTTFAPSN